MFETEPITYYHCDCIGCCGYIQVSMWDDDDGYMEFRGGIQPHANPLFPDVVNRFRNLFTKFNKLGKMSLRQSRIGIAWKILRGRDTDIIWEIILSSNEREKLIKALEPTR